ncbi:MAG: hypothetical protein ACRDU0_12520, partial [Mycobacterium sp.]
AVVREGLAGLNFSEPTTGEAAQGLDVLGVDQGGCAKGGILGQLCSQAAAWVAEDRVDQH